MPSIFDEAYARGSAGSGQPFGRRLGGAQTLS